MTHGLKYLVAGTALVAMTAVPVLADKASQLTYINGSLGRDAESQLRERGFAHVSTHKNDMGYVYSYWWTKRMTIASTWKSTMAG
jgi:hypothetical protein